MNIKETKWILATKRMESTAFFEKKISLTPRDLNEVKNSSIDELLEKKAKELTENKCSEHGFVLSGTVKLLSRSMGYFEAARFTGDTVYYAKLEGKVIYPADGIRVTGEVIRKNKMGLYVEYHKAIRIQIPRDLHIGNEEYDNVQIGDMVEVELKRSKFQINDPYILASGVFIANKADGDVVDKVPDLESLIQKTTGEKGGEEIDEEDDKGEDDEDEDEGDEEDDEGEEEEDEEDEDEDEGDDDEGEDEDEGEE